MARWTILRILTAIPTLLLLAVLTFVLIRLAPGGPFDSHIAWSPEVQKQLNARYGLDLPWFQQMTSWLMDVLKGDLRESFQYWGKPVTEIIRELLPVSLALGSLALALSFPLGILFGCLAAWYHKRWLGNGISWGIASALSLPPFLTASLLIYIFALRLGWLPPALWEEPASAILPVLTLSVRPTAATAKLTQSTLLDVLSSDYIRTAYGKGLPLRSILFKHALKNALIPVITLLGPVTAQLLVGSFLVETLFQIPGLGKQFIHSVLNRDYPLVMGITLVYGVILIVSHILADLGYTWADPRMRV